MRRKNPPPWRRKRVEEDTVLMLGRWPESVHFVSPETLTAVWTPGEKLQWARSTRATARTRTSRRTGPTAAATKMTTPTSTTRTRKMKSPRGFLPLRRGAAGLGRSAERGLRRRKSESPAANRPQRRRRRAARAPPARRSAGGTACFPGCRAGLYGEGCLWTRRGKTSGQWPVYTARWTRLRSLSTWARRRTEQCSTWSTPRMGKAPLWPLCLRPFTRRACAQGSHYEHLWHVRQCTCLESACIVKPNPSSSQWTPGRPRTTCERKLTDFDIYV